MKKSHKLNFHIPFLAIVLASVFLSSLPAKAAETIFVATTGTNNSTCGTSPNPPCQTIKYAVEQRAQNGDLVSIDDGTYSEAQIAVPEGVSLTSTSADNTKVYIRPSASLDAYAPFISLSTVTPGSVGNQTISYLEIGGVNSSYVARLGIVIKNRNDVRIHHCNIHDFKGILQSSGMQIYSSQIPDINDWDNYWPADAQAPGINTNIDALWPINPIQNIEIDNNTIYACGWSPAGTDYGWVSGAVKPYNIKNSTIHDNDINCNSSGGEPIAATAAFLDNVDIYNNQLRMGTLLTNRSSYPLEVWLLRNGCEIYNNVSDAGFSIAYGKETSVHDNTIVFVIPDYSDGNIGIEFIGQSYGQVYNNFINGASVYGVDWGSGAESSGKNWIAEHTIIRNNVIYNTNQIGIGVFGIGATGTPGNNTSRYIDIYNNVIDGQTAAERGDIYNRGTFGIHFHQKNNNGTGTLQYINVKNNVIKDIHGSAGYSEGTIGSCVIDFNRFYNNLSGWTGATPTNTSTTLPGFTTERVNFIGYTPSGGSDLIDAGVVISGYAYNGSAPDLGAIESQTGGDTTPPFAPQGLSVE